MGGRTESEDVLNETEKLNCSCALESDESCIQTNRHEREMNMKSETMRVESLEMKSVF